MTSYWSNQAGDACVVSAVVTFHRERDMARAALASIERMRMYAEKLGLSVEFVMTLDGDDEATAQTVLRHPGLRKTDRLYRIDVSDLSLSRNYAIERANGEYIAILDGDDLFSEAWIAKAVEHIGRSGVHTIAHPELMVAFGAWQAYWYQIGQNDRRFKRESLFSLNHWNACCVARREVFLDVPYECSRVGENGFGFEDWHWNCETIAKGYVHDVVPKTCRFERRKHAGSLNAAHQAASALIRPSTFFESL
jgi:glycosyltransferase involved in cell wall biosynthesis